jgi:hypothetical protein
VKSRVPALLLALVAVALIASGCGSKSTGGGLDSALTYVPKGAPLVVAIDTDPEGDQWKQVDKLIGKFPFGGQIKSQLKSSLNSRSGNIDYEKDIKPLLGHDLVFVVTSASPPPGSAKPYLVAWKVADEGKAQQLIKSGTTKVGKAEGVDLYSSQRGTEFAAIKDGTIVFTSTQAGLEESLHRASSGDHMTEADFNAALGDLRKDALVRMTGDFQSLLEGPDAAPARKVKWIAALRTFGLTVSAEPDGVAYKFRAQTAGGLGQRDLPLAAGAEPAPVVRRAGEIGFGLRNPAQLVTFGQSVAQITDSTGYAKYNREKANLSKQLGVDVDRELISQFTGNATLSVSLTGDVALRADLRDPAAAEATLKKVAPRLVTLHGKKVGTLSAPKGGKGFYTLVKLDGKKTTFGVIGKSFVLASDPARAAEIAGQSPSTVPGAKGALVIAADARSLANAAAKQRGQGVAAQIVTSALGDLIGSVEAEPSGITGDLKLQIK